MALLFVESCATLAVKPFRSLADLNLHGEASGRLFEVCFSFFLLEKGRSKGWGMGRGGEADRPRKLVGLTRTATDGTHP